MCEAVQIVVPGSVDTVVQSKHYVIPLYALRRVFKFNHRQYVVSTKFHLSSINKATTSTMALLVDKLRPRSLDALTYHTDLSNRLASLVKSPNPSLAINRAQED